MTGGKTLPEILRDSILLLEDGRESVVIARGDHEPLDGLTSADQIRLRHDPDWGVSGVYRCETRGWLGAQWSAWYERRGWLGGGGFDIHDVLATDWRISS